MLNNKIIRQLSQIGMRGAFGQLINKMARDNPNIMVLSADLGMTSGLSQFMENFPEQFLNVGIAEQNMIGIATGMSLKGYRVFVTSFAPFATARCLEQIRVNLGEMKVPVTVVGIASGFEIEQFGNSHYGFDDISYMRSISEMTVLSPADTTELAKMMLALLDYDKPAYLRLTKMSRKGLIYKENYDYTMGKANILKDIGDITIIATGSIVHTALQAASEIEEVLRVSCGVIDLHTIKPIDKMTIRNVAEHSLLMVTLEEHILAGGLGSAVAEIMSTHRHRSCLYCIGVADVHPYVGDYEYLLKAYGLDKDSVTKQICEKWNELRIETL